jgi:ABC-type phosphate/phosphonate transport system substrate-binding protein
MNVFNRWNRKNSLPDNPMKILLPRDNGAPILLLSLAWFMLLDSACLASDPESIQIGMAESLVRDIPKAVVDAGIPSFRFLMQHATGLHSTIVPPQEAEELVAKLDKGELKLVVIQGVEYAWEVQKHPQIRPLAIIVNQQRDRRAVMVVGKDSGIEHFSDLKGKSVEVPLRSRLHCHLFLDKECRESGLAPCKFFSKIAGAESIEDALDDAVDGSVQAAMVDQIGIAAFARRKPGRFNKLKVLCTSEHFPDTVVVYRAGAFDETTLQHFREELIKADKKLIGKHILTLWMVTAFEPVPEDYDRLLTTIRQIYPVPIPPVVSGCKKSENSAKLLGSRP